MTDTMHTHHEHCWHGTGVVLKSLLPQYPEICCHCGATRTRRGALTDVGQHGPHYPGETMSNDKQTAATPVAPLDLGTSWKPGQFERESLELFISKVEASLHDPEWLATLCKSQREACNLPPKS